MHILYNAAYIAINMPYMRTNLRVLRAADAQITYIFAALQGHFRGRLMKAINLGSSNVLSTVLKLIIPAVIAQFINVLYSIVDRMFVGNIETIGDTALAAVGVCAPITTIISSFAFLIGTGGAPLFAMALGEGREDNARKILANAAISLAGVALFVAVLFLSLHRPLLYAFGASDHTYEYAKQYLLIYAAGAIVSVPGTGLNQYITAQGYSGMAMVSTIIGAAANIAFDPLFIFVFRLNVAGAAIATVISQFLTFSFVVTFLRLKGTKIKLTLSAPDFKLIGKMVKYGLSPFIIMASDGLIIIIQNAVLQKMGGVEGDTWITVATIVQAFFSLTSMPMLGISEGSQPVLSYAYGAKNERLIKRAELCVATACVIFTITMTIISIFCAAPFVSLFTDNSDITEKAIWGIRVFMIGAIPMAFQYAFVDCFTALGQPKYAITLSLIRKIVFFLGSIIVMPLIWGVSAAFYAEPFADICAAILSSTIFAIIFPRVIRRRVSGEDSLKKRRFPHRRKISAEPAEGNN